MKGFLSKVLVFSFFLVSAFCFLFSATSTYASPQAIKPQSSTMPLSNTNPDVPNNLHNWTQNVMIEVMSSLTCQLAGVDPINPKQPCLGADVKSGKIGFLPSTQTGGAIGFMGTMITSLYTPPLHTADYFQNLAQNFGISKKTYAQQTGTGFDGLKPLMGVWIAFRNIVYLLLVIVFVVIGLAIMLRIKIDPRTVMTIQNQIPKIIVGILAVTFSFAIAGFLIDIMWILIYLIHSVLSGIPGPNGLPIDLQALNPIGLQGKNAIEAAGGIGQISSISSHVSSGLGSTIKNLIGVQGCNNIANCFNSLFNPFNFIIRFGSNSPVGFQPFELIYDLVSFLAAKTGFTFILETVSKMADAAKLPLVGAIPIIGPALSTAISDFIRTGGPLASFTFGTTIYAGTQFMLREGLPWIIAYVIIFIALFSALFRLWFKLLIAYVMILLDIVLAPFWIIGGIIPGSPISLGGWLKDLCANLLAFPVVIAMFSLGKIFTESFGKPPATGQNFVPPLIGNPGNPELISSLVGLGIILITPNIVDMLKQMLKAPKTDMAGGIGKALGPGIAMPSRLAQVGMTSLTTEDKNNTGFLTYKSGALGILGRFLGTRNG
jgi:hypothetical protein